MKTRLLSLLLTLTVGAACATTEASSREPINNVRVVVDPSTALLGSMRLWIRGTSGGPRVLGTSDGIGPDTLTVPFTLTGELYQIVAELRNGRTIASQPFTVRSPRQIVDWNLTTNSVFVRSPPPKF